MCICVCVCVCVCGLCLGSKLYWHVLLVVCVCVFTVNYADRDICVVIYVYVRQCTRLVLPRQSLPVVRSNVSAALLQPVSRAWPASPSSRDGVSTGILLRVFARLCVCACVCVYVCLYRSVSGYARVLDTTYLSGHAWAGCVLKYLVSDGVYYWMCSSIYTPGRVWYFQYRFSSRL